jgi:hypothetical protein
VTEKGPEHQVTPNQKKPFRDFREIFQIGSDNYAANPGHPGIKHEVMNSVIGTST